MTIIVEDGTGKATAECYISVVDATTYHQKNGTGDDWDAVDDKEAALRKATNYLTQAYRLSWGGYRVTTTQRLDWPRAWCPLPDAPSGYGNNQAYVAQNVVPEEVKNACAILALQSNSGDLAPNQGQAQSKVKVDVIEITYDAASPQTIQYRAIDMILAPYLGGGSSGAMTKLVRS